MNGEHHAVIEPVADSTITLNGKVGSNHLLRGIATFAQVRHKRASARSISQLPTLTDSCSKSTTREITTSCFRTFSPSAHKHGVEVILGLGKALNQTILARAFRNMSFFRKCNACFISKISNGVRKIQVFSFHDITEDVSAFGASAKAVPKTRGGVYLE